MDRRGSGFKKIVEDYQMYANVSNEAKPVFKSELSSFFITLPNLQYVVKGQDGTKNGTKAFEAILSHISNDPRNSRFGVYAVFTGIKKSTHETFVSA